MARITVEDCLTKETNRFGLVQLAAKRTKQILRGANVLIDDPRANKAVVTALREIAAGQVRFMTEDEKREAEELELEQEQERVAAVVHKAEVQSPLSQVGAHLFRESSPPSENGGNGENGDSAKVEVKVEVDDEE